MATYFTVKVSEQIGTKKNGEPKKKSVVFLVNAETVTEAEAKVVLFYKGTTLDYEVKQATHSNILEIID